MLMTKKIILFDLFVGQYPVNDFIDPHTDKNKNVAYIELYLLKVHPKWRFCPPVQCSRRHFATSAIVNGSSGLDFHPYAFEP